MLSAKKQFIISKEKDEECLRLTTLDVEKPENTIVTLKNTIEGLNERVRMAEVAATCWQALIENGWQMVNYPLMANREERWQVIRYYKGGEPSWKVMGCGELPEQAMFRAITKIKKGRNEI